MTDTATLQRILEAAEKATARLPDDAGICYDYFFALGFPETDAMLFSLLAPQTVKEIVKDAMRYCLVKKNLGEFLPVPESELDECIDDQIKQEPQP
jgi:hypothetical protein